MPSRTAILLFSRTDRHADARRLGARGLTRELIAGVRRKARRTGLDLVEVTEHAQRGATFGERLANATADTFARGYDRLLIVGHDCPSLQARHLRAAARLLANGSNVLGPDRRGGSWLIGLHRKDFDATAFAKLPWQTAALFPALSALLSDAVQLGTQSDLNTSADIRRHAVRLRSFLASFAVLTDGVTPSGSSPVPRLVVVASAHARRGPPRPR